VKTVAVLAAVMTACGGADNWLCLATAIKQNG
jgi:hypothetical protein